MKNSVRTGISEILCKSSIKLKAGIDGSKKHE